MRPRTALMRVISSVGQKPKIAQLIWPLSAWMAAVLATSTLLADPSEPECRGHSLSYWLEHYTTRATDEDRRRAEEAEVAIREIGTNAIPALLVWLRYEPSQTKTDILNFLARLRRSSFGRWVPAALTSDHTRVPPATLGFFVLGPVAAEAIPELEQMANDATHRIRAARAMIALSLIGPAALSAVEARLSNTNFPFPPESAIGIYLRTRTLLPEQSINTAMARPILVELQTNRNPVLAEGATQVLKALESPSFWERGQTKTLSEALFDLRNQRVLGRIPVPGWAMNLEARTPRQAQTNSTQAPTPAPPPPARPQGDEPYPYPLQPGTQAWDDADPMERIRSAQIPKEWRDHATSWQLFRSAIANPYFDTIHVPEKYDPLDGYSAARKLEVSILSEVDTSPDFGTNVLRWLTGLDLARMASVKCSDVPRNEPCWIDYVIVCHMAGLDSALKTMDISSRQRLFRLAVWDADYFFSRSETLVADAPIRLMHVIYDKPESFRGPLPAGLALPSTSDGQPSPLSLAGAKAALRLTQRP